MAIGAGGSAKLILTDMVRWVWDGEDKKREEGSAGRRRFERSHTRPKGNVHTNKSQWGSRIAETPETGRKRRFNYTPHGAGFAPADARRGSAARVRYVGGVDISFFKESDRAVACLTVLELPSSQSCTKR